MSIDDRGIRATCENGHVQTLYLQNHSEAEARALAGLMDGTSPWFVKKPRDHPLPGSQIGKCGICDSWITCEVFGWPEQP